MIFFAIMSISGIYALRNQTTNGIPSTGIVDIKIQTYESDNNKEIVYDEQEKKVMPGDIISLTPKIHNLGENCYLRVKVDYVDDNTNFLDYITGFSNDFKKYGDYYYYDKVLNSNETVKIFDTIKIPEYITKNAKNNKINLVITAQAIQEKNFEPDYTLIDPWKDITPTQVVNDAYNINSDRQYSKISIIYENSTNEDILVKDNFGENLKIAMPGDVHTNSIDIRNNNKESAKYYLRFDTNEKNNNEHELLNKIKLIITNQKGQVIYNGNLRNKEKILLGEYASNESDKLDFKISIPAELGNEYVNLNPEITLIFSSDNNKKETSEDNKKTTVNPKTGDSIDVAITMFLFSSIGLIIVMILGYIEKRKEER